jgi:hypothetical protein
LRQKSIRNLRVMHCRLKDSRPALAALYHSDTKQRKWLQLVILATKTWFQRE